MILEIMIKDHPKLTQIILPVLAFDILQFLRISKIASKRITQFYTQIIEPNNEIFLFSVLNKLICDKVIEDSKTAETAVLTIEYYYHYKKRLDEKDSSAIEEKEILSVIEWMLKYLHRTQCAN